MFNQAKVKEVQDSSLPITGSSFSWIESITLAITLSVFITIIIASVYFSSINNDDQVRARNIFSVAMGLNQYYTDSSYLESSKRYPISQCSTTLTNSFDYEYTLSIALTGVNSKNKSAFEYINPGKFPQDKEAKFENISKKIDNNKYTCLSTIDTREAGISDSCQYEPENNKHFCYLYSTSPSGDEYRLSFYSRSKNKQYTIRQYRNGTMDMGGIVRTANNTFEFK